MRIIHNLVSEFPDAGKPPNWWRLTGGPKTLIGILLAESADARNMGEDTIPRLQGQGLPLEKLSAIEEIC